MGAFDEWDFAYKGPRPERATRPTVRSDITGRIREGGPLQRLPDTVNDVFQNQLRTMLLQMPDARVRQMYMNQALQRNQYDPKFQDQMLRESEEADVNQLREHLMQNMHLRASAEKI